MINSENNSKLSAIERYLVSLQKKDNGRFEANWNWNSLVTSEWVLVRYIVEAPIDDTTRGGIIRYYEGSQRADGSWGWHDESEGYVFVTALAYVALRLLGIPADAAVTKKALRWLHAQPEGVQSIPMLGKIWLACLDLYDWSGIYTIPPELWLLPSRLPIHPSRFYAFLRMAITSIMYIGGVRFRKRAGPVIHDLRRELYQGKFDEIDWSSCRNLVAKTDLYHPPEPLLRRVQGILRTYDSKPLRSLRKRAMARCFDLILYEERTSRNHTNTPFIGLFNCVAIYAHDPDHEELQPSLSGKEAWKVEDGAGIRYVASRSSVWDTAFAMQALLQSPRCEEFAETLHRAYQYLAASQIREDPPDRRRHVRETNAGSWSFGGLSELGGQLGWPVTDCTAESIVAILTMHEKLPDAPGPRIGEDRLALSAEFLLARQNRDGSYGHYEKRRDTWILPRVNISEVWGSSHMIDFPCGECTGSCISALAMLRDALPSYRRRLDEAILRAVDWVKSIQLDDGSFSGEWGINYTYATYFVAKALRAAGMQSTDPILTRAADWLTSKQRADGGWGESYKSCLEKRYIERDSQVAMTSWALLALMDIHGPEVPSVLRGIEWLRKRVREDGTVPPEGIAGIFFTTSGADYVLYPVYFPAMALARFESLRSGR